MDKPGFGWASSPPGRRRDVFTLLRGEEFVVGEEPSVAGRLLNRLLEEEAIVDVVAFGEQWQAALSDGLQDHQEELAELLSTSTSNGRQIRWDVMKIGGNVSFSLHAHPNVELIYVVKGAIHEYRYTAVSPKTIFDPNDDEGPDLSSPAVSSTATNSSISLPLFVHQSVSAGGFIVNNKGSIHLSFTKEDEETILLVLWSGKHALLPSEFQPQAGVLPALPDEVIPLSKYTADDE